jgi:ankyrin repeat protein
MLPAFRRVLTPPPPGTQQYGRTALHDASVNDHLAVVKLLLQRGADVRVMNQARRARRVARRSPSCRSLSDAARAQFGDTSLHEAGRWGHLEVVRLLLDNQADMSMTNQHGWTPLHFAAAYSQLEVARVLLEAGADVKAKDNVRAAPAPRRLQPLPRV